MFEVYLPNTKKGEAYIMHDIPLGVAIQFARIYSKYISVKKNNSYLPYHTYKEKKRLTLHALRQHGLATCMISIRYWQAARMGQTKDFTAISATRNRDASNITIREWTELCSLHIFSQLLAWKDNIHESWGHLALGKLRYSI